MTSDSASRVRKVQVGTTADDAQRIGQVDEPSVLVRVVIDISLRYFDGRTSGLPASGLTTCGTSRPFRLWHVAAFTITNLQ